LYSTNTSYTVGQAGAGLLIANGDPTGATSFENYPYFNGNEGLIDFVYIHEFNINLYQGFCGGNFKVNNSNFSFARLVNCQFGQGTYGGSTVGGAGAELNSCFIGGVQLSGTNPQQYQGDGVTCFGSILTIRNSWIYAVVHGGNFISSTVILENHNTENNYSTDYFFKCWNFCAVTIKGGHFAIPTNFANSGLPVWDLTGGTGSTSLLIENVSGMVSPVYSLTGSSTVNCIPSSLNQAEYQLFGSPFQITGNTTSSSKNITNVPITTSMNVGNVINATSMSSGNTYKITTSGSTNWTSLGASSTSVGTVFVYNGTSVTGTGGQAQQLNITVGNDYFVSGLGLQNSVVSAYALITGQTYRILSLAGSNFTSAGASNNSVNTYFTATGSAGGSGTALLISTITAISGAGGYLTITLSNNANQSITGATFSYSRIAYSNGLGVSGSLITKGTATPDTVLPNGWGSYNQAAYALGNIATGFYTSGVDSDSYQIVNLSNGQQYSGVASYQFARKVFSLLQSNAQINFPNVPTAAATPLIKFGQASGCGIGYPSYGQTSLIAEGFDALIAAGASGCPQIRLSSSAGLSGQFTMTNGVGRIPNSGYNGAITANSVIMVSRTSAAPANSPAPLVSVGGSVANVTSFSGDTATYNFVILTAV
jgi:hypothetical protein